MSEGWSSQSSDDLDDVGAWMARRNEQLALRPEADAFARSLWNQSIQSGGDLYAGNPSDLTAMGLAALGGGRLYGTTAANDDQGGDDGAFDSSSPAGAGSYPDGAASLVQRADGGAPDPSNASNRASQQAAQSSEGQTASANPSLDDWTNDPWVSELDVVDQPTASTVHRSFLDDLNHSLAARVAGGVVGYVPGLVAGVGRAGWHALEGVGHGLNFTGSLFFPDGRAKAWDETKTATHNALQYRRSVAANPSRLADDAISLGTTAVHNLVPFTTMADTGTGEFGHEFRIGMNGGELAANVAGLIAAPEMFAGVQAARGFEAAREVKVANSIARGLDEQTARYLSKPYKGQGDHVVMPQRKDSIFGIDTPWLKKVNIPDWIMNSSWNVSKPRGLSQGEFYYHHYGVDPHYYGGRLPPDLNGGKGWSGKRLGAERYSGAGRRWARTPEIWKDTAANVAAGEGLGLLPWDDPGAPQ